ncbi:hypothetical protein [Streptomyces sp. C10]|uniref:hypothetical protein n=1 Tax=Streptomyces sp. C10 TaxID=531941 RepID=UPI00398113F0
MEPEERIRRETVKAMFSTLRKAADPRKIKATLRATQFTGELAYLPDATFSQSDLAYALASAARTYESVERADRRPSVPLLLRFGQLCSVQDPALLDRLWQHARGRPFPRRSDLVGRTVPEEFHHLVLPDAPSKAAAARAATVSSLRAAALRAIGHILMQQPQVDPNPHTSNIAAVALTKAAERLAENNDEGGERWAGLDELPPTVREWLAWELHSLGHGEVAQAVKRGHGVDRRGPSR